MTRDEFMKSFLDLESTGRLHLAKMAGKIYDLIEEKVSAPSAPEESEDWVTPESEKKPSKKVKLKAGKDAKADTE